MNQTLDDVTLQVIEKNMIDQYTEKMIMNLMRFIIPVQRLAEIYVYFLLKWIRKSVIAFTGCLFNVQLKFEFD